MEEKNKKAILTEEVNNLYYFIFLQGKDKFYLCGMEFFITNLNKVNVGKIAEESIYLNGYINDKYGNVKVYKAKKRLELRLYPETWISKKLCIEFDIPSLKQKINLREDNLSLEEEIKVSIFTKSPDLDILNQIEINNFLNDGYEIFDFLYNYDGITHGYLLRKTKKQLKFKKDLDAIYFNNLNQHAFDFNQTKELFNKGYVIKGYEYNSSTRKSKFKFYK